MTDARLTANLKRICERVTGTRRAGGALGGALDMSGQTNRSFIELEGGKKGSS